MNRQYWYYKVNDTTREFKKDCELTMTTKVCCSNEDGKNLFLNKDMIFRGLRSIAIIICSSTWSFKACCEPV
jgi:hypothetical protein